MRYFVTGAAGFIGSHLTEALLAAGHEVTGLDDLSTGRLENLAAVTPHPRFRLVLGSILDADLVDDLCDGADRVFHLAAAVGAFVIRDQTLESLRTNIHGTEHVVEAAHRNDARILVASTSEIYGKNTRVGLREDDDRLAGSPLKSRWSYSEAKAIDESLVSAYVAERGLWAVIARLFNTVGPRQTGRYGMVIPRFVRQGLTGEPLTVFGTGDRPAASSAVPTWTPTGPVTRTWSAGCPTARWRAAWWASSPPGRWTTSSPPSSKTRSPPRPS